MNKSRTDLKSINIKCKDVEFSKEGFCVIQLDMCSVGFFAYRPADVPIMSIKKSYDWFSYVGNCKVPDLAIEAVESSSF